LGVQKNLEGNVGLGAERTGEARTRPLGVRSFA